MPDEHTQIEQLTSETRKAHEEMRHDIRDLTRQVTEYTTVTRRHIAEAEKLDRKVDRMLEDHEGRLKSLEVWRGGVDRSLPTKLIDGAQIEADIDRLDADVVAIKTTLAKYGGIALAIWTVAQFVAAPAMQALWKVAFGG
ncbi:MAG: hypothetical protein GC162_10340 [Planctomycetes bacterium]|nr:hypothetical protein [Planctomycetota bacterium]